MEIKAAGFRCMQLSVAARRWPDDMLNGLLTQDGKPVSAADAREAMWQMEQQGYEVVPCSHACDEKGRCTGAPALFTENAS